ncbi:MAG: hypothetical protein HUJ76_10095 [Parasporobacterium sp.]|nr:hypothetical protein [Parasporobacterium sp.]
MNEVAERISELAQIDRIKGYIDKQKEEHGNKVFIVALGIVLGIIIAAAVISIIVYKLKKNSSENTCLHDGDDCCDDRDESDDAGDCHSDTDKCASEECSEGYCDADEGICREWEAGVPGDEESSTEKCIEDENGADGEPEE